MSPTSDHQRTPLYDFVFAIRGEDRESAAFIFKESDYYPVRVEWTGETLIITTDRGSVQYSGNLPDRPSRDIDKARELLLDRIVEQDLIEPVNPHWIDDAREAKRVDYLYPDVFNELIMKIKKMRHVIVAGRIEDPELLIQSMEKDFQFGRVAYLPENELGLAEIYIEIVPEQLEPFVAKIFLIRELIDSHVVAFPWDQVVAAEAFAESGGVIYRQ